MRPPVFHGIVSKGKIKLDNKPRFMEYLAGFEGNRVELVLRKRNPGRSEQYNRYYWAVPVVIIGDYLGYEAEEMHKVLKEKFNVESTARMKTDEFQEYIGKIVRWAAQEFGLHIPDPESVDYK